MSPGTWVPPRGTFCSSGAHFSAVIQIPQWQMDFFPVSPTFLSHSGMAVTCSSSCPPLGNWALQA